jgi:stage IV sporulation protein FB
MIIIPGRIPIAIHPFFWFFAALIGYLNSQTIIGTVIWIGIIMLSVLFHEFGHALTAVAFKQNAQINLVALGGVTSFQGPNLKFWKQFIIVLNGPLAGVLLFFIASLVLSAPLSPTVYGIIATIQMVNLFWSVINLLPVQPLDGGQLLRIALEGFFGVKGFKAALLISVIFSVVLSFYFFLVQAFLVGAFFFLFAFQSFDMWRKTRKASNADREEDFRKMLQEGEALIQKNDKAGAEKIFEEVRVKAAGGLLAAAASQYLALLYSTEGKRREAYELLLPCIDDLEDAGKCLLHELAFEMGNYKIVSDLSAECYQLASNQAVALRNARAFAALKLPEPAGGWLQTAWQHGPFDLKKLLDEEIFASVLNDHVFRKYVDPLL